MSRLMLLAVAIACAMASIPASARADERAAAPGRLVATRHVDHLDLSSREPALLRHHTGALFVAGYGRDDDGEKQTTPRLWRSDDAGATWQKVDVGTVAQGAIGNSDTSLAEGPDGTIYYASLSFDRAGRQGSTWSGGAVTIGVTHDVGRTWRWSTLSKNPHDDRPWIGVDAKGTAHVVWGDGEHVYHSTSSDQGASWAAPAPIHAGGGSSHMSVGPHGLIAVRITPIGAAGSVYHDHADVVAVSADGGMSWREHPAPGVREWLGEEGSIPRWVEPLAWDASGRLYLLWTQADGVHLGVSTDEAATWRSWVVEPTRDDDLPYYPYLIARGDGELAATWYLGAGLGVKWKAALIRVTGGRMAPPSVSDAVSADAWVPSSQATFPRVRTSAGEYTGLAWGPDGSIGVATPIQDGDGHRFGFAYHRFDPPTRGHRPVAGAASGAPPKD